MALNPQYDEIGKGFVQQYYAFFDDPDQRGNLVHLYNVSCRQIDMKCVRSNEKNIFLLFVNCAKHHNLNGMLVA